MGSTTLFDDVFINPEQIVRVLMCTLRKSAVLAKYCFFLFCIGLKTYKSLSDFVPFKFFEMVVC